MSLHLFQINSSHNLFIHFYPFILIAVMWINRKIIFLDKCHQLCSEFADGINLKNINPPQNSFISVPQKLPHQFQEIPILK